MDNCTPEHPQDIPLKRCCTCKTELPHSAFGVQKHSKDGLNPACKGCINARQRRWRKSNLDRSRQRAREYSKRWRENNPEKVREVYKLQYEKHGDAWRARQRRNRIEHRDKILEQKRAYERRHKARISAKRAIYRKKHVDGIREQQRKWRARYPDKVTELSHRRRARKLAAGGEFTAADIELQYRSQKGKCWHCGKPLGDDYHCDHLYPLDRGGTNAANNIVLACPFCNLSKGSKPTWEWNGRLF
jgi:hypothetical protein